MMASTAAHAGREGRLRVLMVMHVPARMELGAARVQLELAEVLRAQGCDVRVLDRDEMLAGRRMGRLGFSPDVVSAAAVRHVRAIAGEYDVIDAHQGNLPVSKQQLGFDGLMVTRSVGLAPLYADFLRAAQKRWPTATRGRLLARPLRRRRQRRSLRHVSATYRLCDLLVVANQDERAYVTERLGLGEKTVVLPLGISEQRLSALAAVEVARRADRSRIAFIGDWNARKGSLDWPEIVAEVHRRVPDASFAFLGTHLSAAAVGASVGLAEGALDVVPSYDSEQLPALLEGVRAGALPSYIEGLGLGVLEKLAAGIPSVCYDVPGPRETIGRVDPSLLVPAGDTRAFAARLAELLALEEQPYRELSDRCRSVAREFSWSAIGLQTLSIYRQRLAILKSYTLAS